MKIVKWGYDEYFYEILKNKKEMGRIKKEKKKKRKKKEGVK